MHRSLVRLLSFCLITSCLSSACYTHRQVLDTDLNKPPAQLLELGEAQTAVGDYRKAIKTLEHLQASYPYQGNFRQGQLALANAYYLNNDSEIALDELNRFIKMQARDPLLPEAYYLKAMVHYKNYLRFMFQYLPLNINSRDQTDANLAFKAFKQLLLKYPNCKFASEAKQRMVFLRNQLGQFELNIAKYYYNHGAYLSAYNRINDLLVKYYRTPAAWQGLSLKEQCLLKVQPLISAQTIFKPEA